MVKDWQLLIVGTLPAALAGLLLNGTMEEIFLNRKLVGLAFLLTTGFLVSTRFVHFKNRRVLTLRIALIVGLFQALAILPGVSRSGATIVAGIWLGLKPTEAFEFSFLLSIPAILGAMILQFDDLTVVSGMNPATVGFLVALITGGFFLMWLKKIVESGRLFWFFPYTLLLGGVLLFW